MEEKNRCFKNFTVNIDYAANTAAWMTADIFNKWLRSYY